MCAYVNQEGYQLVYDNDKRIGPYAYKGNQWVGFDDVETIAQKSKYIRDHGFGGGMIWALDLDDFNNMCGCEKYPLLKTINRVLRNYNSPDPHCTLDSNNVYHLRTPASTYPLLPPQGINGGSYAVPYFNYPLSPNFRQKILPYTHYHNQQSNHQRQRITSYPIVNQLPPQAKILYHG